ncbi:MAG: serine/threonine protein kinase [Myxococcales bacterium]|nr:serine/threonine protein kinase [Myxococcales bacterium]
MTPLVQRTVAFTDAARKDGAGQAATKKDPQPQAKANSGFQRVWKGLDIESATIELSPNGTFSPRYRAPDTDRRAKLAELPVVALGRLDTGNDTVGPDLQVGAELGSGGMGLVLSATQLSLGRDVAIKTIKPDVADMSAASSELVREARIAGRLEHPNILPIYSLGQDSNGLPVLVMKRVEGTAWRALLQTDLPYRTGAGDTRSATEVDASLVRHLLILIQVCNAIGFAHSRGVVHRDLKPENVMVGSFGEVYVLDWGVAVEIGKADQAGHGIAGTPSWMAPEMVAAKADGLGPHTDIYLLGGLLHAIVTGTARHQGDDLFQILYQAWLSQPAVYSPDVPELLADLCNRATAKDPAARPLNVAEFKADLEHFLRNRTSLTLTAEARTRLEDLRQLVMLVLGDDRKDHLPLEAVGDDTAGLIHRLGGEARFGFQQALSTWPQNPEAIAGYQQVCAVMARFAIAEGDVRTAGHLIGEITEPDDALLTAWHALSTARKDDASSAARLLQIERDMDFETGARSRSALALSIGIIWAAIPLAIGLLERQGLVAITFPRYIGAGLVWAAFVVVGVYLGRKQLFSNRINRAFVRSLAGAVAAPLLQRTVSWVQGATVHQAVTQDMVVFFLVLLGMAATIDWRLAWGAGVYGVAASLSTIWPNSEFFVLAAANLIALGTVAWVWRPQVASESRRARLMVHVKEVRECVGSAAWRGLRMAAHPVDCAVPLVQAAIRRSTSSSQIPREPA